MKKKITLQEAFDGIKGLFDLVPFGQHEGHKSFYTQKEDGTATFFFDKNQYWRDEVINRLAEYFSDKVIDGGQCRIDSITLVWTTVHLEKREEVDGIDPNPCNH